jgi:hypothetical protein
LKHKPCPEAEALSGAAFQHPHATAHFRSNEFQPPHATANFRSKRIGRALDAISVPLKTRRMARCLAFGRRFSVHFILRSERHCNKCGSGLRRDSCRPIDTLNRSEKRRLLDCKATVRLPSSKLCVANC